MHDEFFARYVDPAAGAPSAPFEDPRLADVAGYREVATRLAGLPLGGGLLYFLTATTGPLAVAYVSEAHPHLARTAVPIARTRTGSIVAVDHVRVGADGPQLLLMDVGYGDVYDVDFDVRGLLDDALLTDADTYLDVEWFARWTGAGGRAPGESECVGYRVPASSAEGTRSRTARSPTSRCTGSCRRSCTPRRATCRRARGSAARRSAEGAARPPPRQPATVPAREPGGTAASRRVSAPRLPPTRLPPTCLPPT